MARVASALYETTTSDVVRGIASTVEAMMALGQAPGAALTVADDSEVQRVACADVPCRRVRRVTLPPPKRPTPMMVMDIAPDVAVLVVMVDDTTMASNVAARVVVAMLRFIDVAIVSMRIAPYAGLVRIAVLLTHLVVAAMVPLNRAVHDLSPADDVPAAINVTLAAPVGNRLERCTVTVPSVLYDTTLVIVDRLSAGCASTETRSSTATPCPVGDFVRTLVLPCHRVIADVVFPWRVRRDLQSCPALIAITVIEVAPVVGWLSPETLKMPTWSTVKITDRVDADA